MKRNALLILVAGFLLAADAKDDAAKQELEKFQGAWTVASAEKDGQEIAADQLADFKLIVEGDKRTLKKGDTIVAQSTYKIDPTKKPKTIGITMTEGPLKDKILPGIYELDGDTLKICIALIGQDRPKDFTTQAGNGHLLQVFKREKK